MAAINEVASSGKEVHTATTVRPMTRSDSPRSTATSTAASSNKCPARINSPSPRSMIVRLLNHGAGPCRAPSTTAG
ncbi:hypothetical protein D9M73_293070 [compost metagenome]